MRSRKLLDRIREGSVQNIRFEDLSALLEDLGFRHSRTRGSHYVYMHARVPVVLCLQPLRGEAKPYQVRQIVRVIEEYNLGEDDGR